MLRLALLFLVIALIAGFFGYGNVEVISFAAAKLLFFVFIVLAVLFLIGGLARGSPRDMV